MKIKICGITQACEAAYLNQNQVDYAGFVFFEKSKRYVTVEKAKEIMQELNPSIKKVAVLVSPSVMLVHQVMEAGFDVIQIHKELSSEVLQTTKLPIWYAVNVESVENVRKMNEFLDGLTVEEKSKITGIVMDGAAWGSGKTFDWSLLSDVKIAKNRMLVLAGGLNCENVKDGIKLFSPDVVDVSSSVEGETGKSLDKINAFVQAVRLD